VHIAGCLNPFSKVILRNTKLCGVRIPQIAGSAHEVAGSGCASEVAEGTFQTAGSVFQVVWRAFRGCWGYILCCWKRIPETILSIAKLSQRRMPLVAGSAREVARSARVRLPGAHFRQLEARFRLLAELPGVAVHLGCCKANMPSYVRCMFHKLLGARRAYWERTLLCCGGQISRCYKRISQVIIGNAKFC